MSTAAVMSFDSSTQSDSKTQLSEENLDLRLKEFGFLNPEELEQRRKETIAMQTEIDRKRKIRNRRRIKRQMDRTSRESGFPSASDSQPPVSSELTDTNTSNALNLTSFLPQEKPNFSKQSVIPIATVGVPPVNGPWNQYQGTSA